MSAGGGTHLFKWLEFRPSTFRTRTTVVIDHDRVRRNAMLGAGRTVFSLASELHDRASREREEPP